MAASLHTPSDDDLLLTDDADAFGVFYDRHVDVVLAYFGELRGRLTIGANGPIALAGRSLWVTVDDGTGRNAGLLRLDRRTGRPTGSLRLGARVPAALVAVGADVWAVIGDGTALVVR